MSSVKREYALPAPAITEVLVTSGTGSTSSPAQVYIDPRKSSVFRVDISDMVGESTDVFVTLDTFAGAPGALAGKEITVLFSGNPNNNDIYVACTDKFGPNVSDVYMNGTENGVPTAMKLMSNGTDFVLLTSTYNDN